MSWELAQLNIARLRYDLAHPAVADFVEGLDVVNATAEQSDGFVWRLEGESGNATGMRIYDDPMFIVNLSVWQSLDALQNFIRAEPHTSFLKRRREWFERPEQAYAVLWWIPLGHRPTVDEAEERLDYLREHGSTPFAFSFRDYHAAPEADARQEGA